MAPTPFRRTDHANAVDLANLPQNAEGLFHILKRNKDKLLSRNGSGSLAPRHISVPFGVWSRPHGYRIMLGS